MKTVDAKTLNQWLKEESAVLVDVREPAEHLAARITGARLHPLSRFDPGDLAGHGNRIVIHCLKGGRGATACARLLQEQPDLDVYNLEGGIEAWRAAGLPVVTGERKILPLDRQVQLAIGLILLATAALALLADPLFVVLAGLIGLGLTVAGLTGFCGMAMVLARMPWNRA